MIAFTIFGKPQPQGSLKAFRLRTARGPKVVLTSDNSALRPWRQQVSQVALEAIAGEKFTIIRRPVPVTVQVEFRTSALAAQAGPRSQQDA